MTNDKDSAVLLPCPFCGGEAEVQQQGTNRQSHIIACTNCGCRLETGETWNAGSLWNTRKPTQSDALLEGDAQTILYLLGVRHGREDERAKIAAETRQPTQSDALREALVDLLHAVCGKTGFAETVRRDSGRIYPWPALDLAEAKALEALEQSK